MNNQKKKYFLKKIGGKESLRARYRRVNKFYDNVMDYIEETDEEDFDYDVLEEKMSDLKNQLDVFYKLAIDRENDNKTEKKELKSNYNKLVAELILIKKKKPDFVSENIKKFLG